MTYNPAEWNELEREVWERFGYSCIICLKKADVIHEIIPKSKAPKNWSEFDNRALLCVACHEQVHREGAGSWARLLQHYRQLRLDLYG